MDRHRVQSDDESLCDQFIERRRDNDDDSLLCFCRSRVNERSVDSLQCSQCKNFVHYTCSELPNYQLGLFLKTSRKYICKQCVIASFGASCLNFVSDNFTVSTSSESSVHEDKAKPNPDPNDTLSGRPVNSFLEVEMRSGIEKVNERLVKIDETLSNMLQGQQQSPTILLSKDTQTDILPSKDTQTDSNTGTQTNAQLRQNQTYADAVKSAAISAKTSVETAQADRKSNTSHTLRGKKARDDVRGSEKDRHFKSDVNARSSKFHKPRELDTPRKHFQQNHFQVRATEVKHTQKHPDVEHVKPDLPKVWAFHDSVLNKIDGQRLGDSYGFSLEMKKAYTIHEVKTELSKDCAENPDAIILHVGLNDLKHDTAENCSTAFVDLVNNTCDTHKNSSVIVSRVAPTNIPHLKAKADLFNAYNASRLLNNNRVSFISHENLKTDLQRLQSDNLHPTTRGASVLAGNIGRHVHHIFWKRIEYKTRQRRPQLRPNNIGFHPRHRWNFLSVNPFYTPWMYY